MNFCLVAWLPSVDLSNFKSLKSKKKVTKEKK